MVDWRVKGVLQKVCSYVPGGEQVHYWLQRTMGGLRHFAEECTGRIDDWRLMTGHMRTVGQPIAGTTMMEVGSGWYPALPFCAYLAGAARIHTFDLARHYKLDLAIRCAEIIGDHLELIAELGDRNRSDVIRLHNRILGTLRAGGTYEQATAGCVRYTAPADARDTTLPDQSVDWAFSNSVLQHIPTSDIAALMSECFRVLRPGGFTFHSVNCGDNYAYGDPSITQLNYLRFSEKEWKKWNNKFQYQNRLRAKDFVELIKNSGFCVVVDTTTPLENRLRELARIPVAPCFSRYTANELCVTTVDIVGQKTSAWALERKQAQR